MKNELRKKFKSLRETLSTNQVKEYSQSIFKHITTSSMWAKSQRVMCYLSIGNEVQTKPIIERAWAEKKEVIIPVCQKDLNIKPSLLNSFADLEPKTMGILEPKDGKLIQVSPQSIDLCLIPGVAFDLHGHRIGFGAGFYDRFLPLLKAATPKVALAYKLQLSPNSLPADAHDVLMDYIITEKGVYQVTQN